MAYGLYEVVPGRIYQVRGFDLANISFIKGDTGWIIFDPLTAAETARAALEFINETERLILRTFLPCDLHGLRLQSPDGDWSRLA